MARSASSKGRILAFFLDNPKVVLRSQDIQDASGGAVEWARRLRELRAEGWRILTNNDRADLKPGEYILEDETPPKDFRFERPISRRLRAQVFERNGYTCQMCGIGAGDPTEEGGTARLHIGHIKDRVHGGKDETTNLRALCSDCNQGAKNLVQEPPSHIWLLGQIRRATIDDQQAALAWLKYKFREDTP